MFSVEVWFVTSKMELDILFKNLRIRVTSHVVEWL